MTLFQAIILGIIQGATEFIPVSSSGHLVIAPYLLGWSFNPKEAFVFDVLSQAATLVAVLVYFRQDLVGIFKSVLSGIFHGQPFVDEDSTLGWLLILSTFPAGITALLFKDVFERAFNSPTAAAIFLFVTAIFLFSAERSKKGTKPVKSVTWLDSLFIGIFQIFALFPGVSRSGSTISGGMIRGLNRESAARFSFLMSVPILSASGALAVYDLFKLPNLPARLPIFLAGFVTAAIVGYLVIRWLLSYLSKGSLYPFAMYCALFGTFVLIYIMV